MSRKSKKSKMWSRTAKSVLNVFSNLFALLSDAVELLGGSIADLRWLASPAGEETLTKVAKLIVDASKEARNLFLLVIDYGRPLTEAISAGHYDYVNENITEVNFPANQGEEGKKQAEFKVFLFDRDIESDEAIVEMEKEGFRPATLRELLAFGEKNPELQRQFPVIALGSLWADLFGHRQVALLYGDAACRYLNLDYFTSRWYRNYRFLAVRKSLAS